MAITPAAPAPPRYNVDFQHPQESDLLAGLIIGFVGITICTVFVLLRVYAKAVLAKSFAIEDVCVVVAWLLAIAVQVIFICTSTSTTRDIPELTIARAAPDRSCWSAHLGALGEPCELIHYGILIWNN